jgi:hypothetical protein
MYYSYIEIEYVATSFSSARMDLADKLLPSQYNKKAEVGTQESVTYFAHAVDLAFAITVWKCQGGTFEYIIALLEHSPGSPILTFEKLNVMFT